LPGNSCVATLIINATTSQRSGAAIHRRWPVGACGFAVRPTLPAGEALVLWLPPYDPATVLLTAAPSRFIDARSLGALARRFERRAADGTYLIVSDDVASHRIVLADRARADRAIAVVIPLDGEFLARADAAIRLWRLVYARRSTVSNNLTRHARRRLILTLRALDAHLASESYRTIAQGLFGRQRVPVGSAWKAHDLRDRTARLVRSGVGLMRGGYLDLLRGRRRRF
jgi:hypothetical protein